MAQSTCSHDEDIPHAAEDVRATLFALPFRPSRCQQGAEAQNASDPYER
jgi:hypothetical protein